MPIKIAEIKDLVARIYQVQVSDLESVSRKRAVLHPRCIAMHLAREHTDLTLKAIGKSFKRHESTVYRSIKKIKRGLLPNSGTLKEEIKFLLERLDK